MRWQAFAFVSFVAVLPPAKAESTIPPNPQIEINYEAPTNPAFMPIYNALKKRQVLETLQRFLVPLKLPIDRKLVIKSAQCDASASGYQSGGPATICYEYIAQVDQLAPRSPVALVQGEVTREQAINGPIIQALLHNIALAVFDLWDIPVWGRTDDAADRLAAFVMVQFGPDVAWNAIVGTAWFLASNTTETISYSDVRGAFAQRYYTTLCIALGAELHKETGAEWGKQYSFAGFLSTAAGSLPMSRANSCGAEYELIKRAFVSLIFPHVDQSLLTEVRQSKWVDFGR